MARPEVSLLILAHDTPGEVDALLESIVRCTGGSYEILLMDNGSSFAGREAHAALAKAYGARLIPIDANVTFSIANNLGVRVCSGDEVVFLNSDVVVTHDWLHNLRAALHSAPDVGLVGPRTTFSQARQGGIWLDDDTPAGVQRFGRFFNHGDPSRWFEIDWLAGFALLARRSALDAVGGFDESLPWHGLEDRALGEAVRAAGWRALVAGDTFVYHSGHRTFQASEVNRTATRAERPAVPAGAGPLAEVDGGRLVKDEQGLVFEIHDGVAYHLEILPGLIRQGRPIREAVPQELAQLAYGPPISACRVRGTDQVWVLHRAVRRRVRGDPERIRRLPWVWQAEPGEVDPLPAGIDIQVHDAVGPVPEIPPRLPFNPALIASERLATADLIAAEIRAALEARQGYALIRLHAEEALLLNHGMWPAPWPDRAAAGVPENPEAGAAALRQAIIGADAVSVLEDRSRFPGAPLLELLLFHYDLYPRRRCSADVGGVLMGIDPVTGIAAGASFLGELVQGRRVAVVGPRTLAPALPSSDRDGAEDHGFDVRVSVGLDDLDEVEPVFQTLAAQRGAFDVVLTTAAVPAKLLCSRLARESGVVALDLGAGLDDVIRRGYRTGRATTSR